MIEQLNAAQSLIKRLADVEKAATSVDTIQDLRAQIVELVGIVRDIVHRDSWGDY